MSCKRCEGEECKCAPRKTHPSDSKPLQWPPPPEHPYGEGVDPNDGFVRGSGFPPPPPLGRVVDAPAPEPPDPTDSYVPIEPPPEDASDLVWPTGKEMEHMPATPIRPPKNWPRLPSDDDPTWISVEAEIRKDAYYMMGEPDLAALWADEPAEALIRAGERRARSEKRVRWIENLDTRIALTAEQAERFGRALVAAGVPWFWVRWTRTLANLFRKRS